MILLALMDPDGTIQRRSRKLKRRIYYSKVRMLYPGVYIYTCLIVAVTTVYIVNIYYFYRDQISLGTVMDMTN